MSNSTNNIRTGKSDKTSEALTNICNGLVTILQSVFRIFFLGMKKSPWKNTWFWIFTALYGLMFSTLTIKSYHLKLLNNIDSEIFTANLMNLISNQGVLFNFFGMFVLYWITLFFSIGFIPYTRIKKMQKNFDPLALKNSQGEKPKVLDVTHPMIQKTKVLVKTNGIGLDSFENSKGALASAFNNEVESISTITGKPSLVELIFTQKVLPKMCRYNDMVKGLKTPCSFIVGEGQNGILTQDITSLPHLLIAGTTGGGKSVFFKNAICGLLESSPNLQMYLLDLKGGVEMKKFEQFKNVTVACDIDSALDFLKTIKKEMDKRYITLRADGLENINTDKLDRIIVGVDEASILYQSDGKGSENHEEIMQARAITDKIAKLGRAAGIHLILATQKVTKQTISTSIQECVTGRMCFRMNTIQGSAVMLGRKDAMELPDIDGRALWQKGLELEEVQAPFISKDDISELAKKINLQFEKGEKELKQKLLIASEESNSDGKTKSFKENKDDK